MTRACWCAAASIARLNREPDGFHSTNERRNMRNLRLEKSIVTDPKQCGTCQHCGAPIEMGMNRFIHPGTFALGCSKPCAQDAAVTLLELADDVREAERCNGRGE